MSLYAIILEEPSAPVWKAVRARWPNHHYILNEVVAFVAPEGITSVGKISSAIGLGDELDASAMVFRCGRYSGYATETWVDWLDEAT